MVPDRDLGAGSDEAFGNRAAKTLRAAGDDGAAAVQVDLVHWFSPALQRPAAIDDVRNTRRERAFIAGEIDGERGDLLGGAESSHRLPRDEHLAPVGAC